MWSLLLVIAYSVDVNVSSYQEIEEEDAGPISVINFYLPALKFQCDC
jgi:hypothetical protein